MTMPQISLYLNPGLLGKRVTVRMNTRVDLHVNVKAGARCKVLATFASQQGTAIGGKNRTEAKTAETQSGR